MWVYFPFLSFLFVFYGYPCGVTIFYCQTSHVGLLLGRGFSKMSTMENLGFLFGFGSFL